MKGTNKLKEHTETLLICFYSDRDLSQSEENIYVCVKYIYSLLIDPYTFILFWLTKSWNVSIKFPWVLLVYLCIWPLQFFSKSFPFLLLFLWYLYFGTFLFHMIMYSSLYVLSYLTEMYSCYCGATKSDLLLNCSLFGDFLINCFSFVMTSLSIYSL